MIIDPEFNKPLQCSNCGGRDIVNPINERDIDLRCLTCGHEKPHELAPHERIFSGGTTVWKTKQNPKSYREF